jgi:hypothetical protein
MERIIDRIAKTFRLGSVGMLPLFVPALLTYFTSPVEQTKVINTIEVSNVAVIEAVQQAYFQENLQGLYQEMKLEQKGLSYPVFYKALIGQINLKDRQEISEKPIITIVDFEKPSTQKRLWILDLATREVKFHTYVAHGRGSGDNIAQVFSNITDSHMSSLGFYVTADTYYGQHGLSLKLEGKEEGLNSKALERNIVVHGAEYVSEDFIRQQGRLGRSHGCPALPVEDTAAIIDVIKDRTVLYLNGPTQEGYSSELINPAVAKNYFLQESFTL